MTITRDIFPGSYNTTRTEEETRITVPGSSQALLPALFHTQP